MTWKILMHIVLLINIRKVDNLKCYFPCTNVNVIISLPMYFKIVQRKTI